MFSMHARQTQCFVKFLILSVIVQLHACYTVAKLCVAGVALRVEGHARMFSVRVCVRAWVCA